MQYTFSILKINDTSVDTEYLQNTGGSKGGASDATTPPPSGSNCFPFLFMQFSGKKLAQFSVGTPTRGILDPPLSENKYSVHVNPFTCLSVSDYV